MFTAVAISAVSMMTAYETADCFPTLKKASPDIQLDINSLFQTQQCSSQLADFLAEASAQETSSCILISLLQLLCPAEYEVDVHPRGKRLLSESLVATKEALQHEARYFTTNIAYDKGVLDEIDERLSFQHGPGFACRSC